MNKLMLAWLQAELDKHGVQTTGPVILAESGRKIIGASEGQLPVQLTVTCEHEPEQADVAKLVEAMAANGHMQVQFAELVLPRASKRSALAQNETLSIRFVEIFSAATNKLLHRLDLLFFVRS